MAGKFVSELYMHEVSRQHIMACLEPDWLVTTTAANENMLRLHALFRWSITHYELGTTNLASILEMLELLPKAPKDADDEEQDKGRALLPWSDMPACMTKVRSDKTMEARAMEFIILSGARLADSTGRRNARLLNRF
jgi:hypothetical protein